MFTSKTLRNLESALLVLLQIECPGKDWWFVFLPGLFLPIHVSNMLCFCWVKSCQSSPGAQHPPGQWDPRSLPSGWNLSERAPICPLTWVTNAFNCWSGNVGLSWWLLKCRRHRWCRFDCWVRKSPWRRKWQPTPVFLSGKFHGQRSLAGSKRVRHNWATRRRKCWHATKFSTLSLDEQTVQSDCQAQFNHFLVESVFRWEPVMQSWDWLAVLAVHRRAGPH